MRRSVSASQHLSIIRTIAYLSDAPLPGETRTAGFAEKTFGGIDAGITTAIRVFAAFAVTSSCSPTAQLE